MNPHLDETKLMGAFSISSTKIQKESNITNNIVFPESNLHKCILTDSKVEGQNNTTHFIYVLSFVAEEITSSKERKQ